MAMDPFSLGNLLIRVSQGDEESTRLLESLGMSPVDLQQGTILSPGQFGDAFRDDFPLGASTILERGAGAGGELGTGIRTAPTQLDYTSMSMEDQPPPPPQAPPPVMTPPNTSRTPPPNQQQQRWPQVRMPEQTRPVFSGGVAGSQKAPDFGMRAGLTPAMALLQALTNRQQQPRNSSRGGGGGLGDLLNG